MYTVAIVNEKGDSVRGSDSEHATFTDAVKDACERNRNTQLPIFMEDDIPEDQEGDIICIYGSSE